MPAGLNDSKAWIAYDDGAILRDRSRPDIDKLSDVVVEGEDVRHIARRQSFNIGAGHLGRRVESNAGRLQCSDDERR